MPKGKRPKRRGSKNRSQQMAQGKHLITPNVINDQTSPESNIQEKKEHNQQSGSEEKAERKRKTLLSKTASDVLGVLASVIAIVTIFFSLFPHLTLSEPVMLNSKEFFSKSMTITNDGILPVFHVKCGIAIGRKGIASDAIRVISDDPLGAHLFWKDCYVPMLEPGDSYTITTEPMISLPAEHATQADFAIIISYVPILPPVRMDKCTHFILYKDTADQRHWFRSPGGCPWFPWLN